MQVVQPAAAELHHHVLHIACVDIAEYMQPTEANWAFAISEVLRQQNGRLADQARFEFFYRDGVFMKPVQEQVLWGGMPLLKVWAERPVEWLRLVKDGRENGFTFPQANLLAKVLTEAGEDEPLRYIWEFTPENIDLIAMAYARHIDWRGDGRSRVNLSDIIDMPRGLWYYWLEKGYAQFAGQLGFADYKTTFESADVWLDLTSPMKRQRRE